MDPISAVDLPQSQNLRFLVPRPETWKNYDCCPWATSILAIDPISEDLVLCPVTCKRWGCPYCAKQKIRKLAFLTNGAKPNRMITYTFHPSTFDSPKEAWEITSPLVPEANRWVRDIYGECEYLRVTELHKSGWPHYHCLVRSSFVPARPLAVEWTRLVKNKRTTIEPPSDDPEELRRRRQPFNVDVSKIKDTFSSFRYLVKYLTKLHKIEWTDRHVSYSRNFFNPADREKIKYPERQVEERNEEHPWLYLYKRYWNDQIAVDESGCYHLPGSFCGEPLPATRADVGLPHIPEMSHLPTPPKRQQSAFDTSPQEDYSDNSF